MKHPSIWITKSGFRRFLLINAHLRRIMNSIDNVLHLSQIFGIEVNDPGSLLLQFVFSTVWQLVEAALGDEGLLELTEERKFRWNVPQDMELDVPGNYNGKRNEYQEMLQSRNTVMAVELIGLFLQNKVTSRILFLARRNMSELYLLTLSISA